MTPGMEQYRQLILALSQRRLALELNVIKFAERAGYSRTSIRNWEALVTYPTVLQLNDWCEALGMSLKITAEMDGD